MYRTEVQDPADQGVGAVGIMNADGTTMEHQQQPMDQQQQPMEHQQQQQPMDQQQQPMDQQQQPMDQQQQPMDQQQQPMDQQQQPMEHQQGIQIQDYQVQEQHQQMGVGVHEQHQQLHEQHQLHEQQHQHAHATQEELQAQAQQAEAHAAATQAHYSAVAAGGQQQQVAYGTAADFGVVAAAPQPAAPAAAFGTMGFGGAADFGAAGTSVAAAAAAAGIGIMDNNVRRPVSDLTLSELRDIVSRLLPGHGEAVSAAASETQGGPASQRPRITVVDDAEVVQMGQGGEQPWERFRTDASGGVGGLSVTDTSFLNTLATTARQQQQQRAASSIVARASHRERIVRDTAAVIDPATAEAAAVNARMSQIPTQHPNSSSAGLATSEKMRDYQSQLNAAWMERFAQLTMFKAQHGHCRPPQSEPLGAWCGHQRQKYRDRAEGKLSNLTDERVALLETVGFDFATEKKNRHQKPSEDGRRHGPRNPERSFEDWVDELRWYREQHGSADVPVKGNPKLGAWVVRQRQHYRKMKEGGRSSLTTERIVMLENLGFVWTSSRSRQKPDGSSRPKGPRLRWGEWFGRLKDYNEKYGTCKVSTADKSPDPKLGKWVEWQRQCHRMWKRGEKSSMNQEKCDKFEALGFVWEPRPDKKKGEGGSAEKQVITPFEDWVELFKKYREENDGDANVPRKVPRLGSWVGQQRKHYKLLQEGKPSRLTPERIAMLDEAGFIWTQRKSSKSDGSPKTYRKKSDAERKRASFDRSPQLKFEEWVDQLKAFKEEHGHVKVNVGRKSPTPKLGRWVDSQRQFYKKRAMGAPTSLTQERVDMLDALGFVWTTRRDQEEIDREKQAKAEGKPYITGKRKRGRPSKADVAAREALEERLQDLKRNRRRERGQDSDAETDESDDDGGGGGFTSVYDAEVEKAKKGRGRGKGKKRRKKDDKKNRGKSKKFEDWMELLSAFKELHGHVRVDTGRKSPTPHLGKWVDSQREQYKLFKAKTPSTLDDEKVAELEEIGFVWCVKEADKQERKAAKEETPMSEDGEAREGAKWNNDEFFDANTTEELATEKTPKKDDETNQLQESLEKDDEVKAGAVAQTIDQTTAEDTQLEGTPAEATTMDADGEAVAELAEAS